MQNFQLTFSEKEIKRTARQFLKLTGNFKHFAFFGGMGVGKTTFIKAICHHLHTSDLVSSPTFSIVNEYTISKSNSIFHFDFYRIKKEEELLDIGFYDYCNPNDYCFIEWPEKAENIIPDSFIKLQLEEIEGGIRKLTFTI